MEIRMIDESTLQRVLFCQIQQNAIESGSAHYDGYKNWCLSGLEVEKAINDIFSKSGPFAPTIAPETLPIVRELREKLMLTEANQNHFKEERDLFLFKMKETAEAATSEIDRRNKTICELREKLERVTAERDALLKEFSGECGMCLYYEDCIKNHYSCGGCEWEWRGIQEVQDDE